MANKSKKTLTHQQKVQLRLYKPVMNYRNGHKKQRIKNNILTRYYNNGRIQSKRAFDEEKWDVCSGPFEQRYENGSLRVKGEILEKALFDMKIGQWIEYYGSEYKKGSGIIKCMGKFELFNNYYTSDHDKFFPFWTVYRDNCLGFSGTKKEGSLKNGVWKYFSPDGILASEMIWKKGIKWEGTITSFHPNGRQWKEEIFETKKKKLILKNQFWFGFMH